MKKQQSAVGSRQSARGSFDPTDIFSALNAAKVQYLVIGGVAAILHGVNRFTWDVDLSVELSVGNLATLELTLTRLGFAPRVPAPIQGLADPKTRQLWTENRNMKVYSFFERTGRARVIDIMVKPLPAFKAVYRRRVTVRAGGVAIPLVPVDVLVAMKRRAGRPEDLLDIAALKQLGKAR